jgi:hypothetical protein
MAEVSNFLKFWEVAEESEVNEHPSSGMGDFHLPLCKIAWS